MIHVRRHAHFNDPKITKVRRHIVSWFILRADTHMYTHLRSRGGADVLSYICMYLYVHDRTVLCIGRQTLGYRRATRDDR